MKQAIRRLFVRGPGVPVSIASSLPSPSWTIATLVLAALAINESQELFVGAGAIGLLSIGKTCLAVQWLRRMGGILRVSLREYILALLLDATPALAFLVHLLLSMLPSAFPSGGIEWGVLISGALMASLGTCMVLMGVGVWASPIVFWLAYLVRVISMNQSRRSTLSWSRISAWGILPVSITLCGICVMTQPLLGWRVQAAHSSLIQIAERHNGRANPEILSTAEPAGSFRVKAIHRDANGIRFETGKSGMLALPAGIAWCPDGPPRTRWDRGRRIAFIRIMGDWYKWREEFD